MTTISNVLFYIYSEILSYASIIRSCGCRLKGKTSVGKISNVRCIVTVIELFTPFILFRIQHKSTEIVNVTFTFISIDHDTLVLS